MGTRENLARSQPDEFESRILHQIRLNDQTDGLAAAGSARAVKTVVDQTLSIRVVDALPTASGCSGGTAKAT